jgi:hypothetical protein
MPSSTSRCPPEPASVVSRDPAGSSFTSTPPEPPFSLESSRLGSLSSCAAASVFVCLDGETLRPHHRTAPRRPPAKTVALSRVTAHAPRCSSDHCPGRPLSIHRGASLPAEAAALAQALPSRRWPPPPPAAALLATRPSEPTLKSAQISRLAQQRTRPLRPARTWAGHFTSRAPNHRAGLSPPGVKAILFSESQLNRFKYCSKLQIFVANCTNLIKIQKKLILILEDSSPPFHVHNYSY